MLWKKIGINNHTINLINGKLTLYVFICSLELIKLKTLKTYIEINLAVSFIYPSKPLANFFVFFIWKFDCSLHLYVNYQGVNNITIKY